MTPGTGSEIRSSLRIVGIDPERRFSGGETQVLGLTLELIDRGHQAELICDPVGPLWERAQANGVTCHPLTIRNAIDLGAALRLRRILARERYDIVHFHTSRAHSMAPFVRGLAGAMVVTRRMDYRPNRLFAPYLYGRAVDGVAAISFGVADALAGAGVPHDRVTVIPSGVDCQHFHPPSKPERAEARRDLRLPENAVVVGTVGTLEERKGHRYLLEAMAQSPWSEYGDVRCLIAGDGSQRDELAGAVDRLGVGQTTRFLGRVQDSRTLLWALDIFVFPSLLEGLGVALIEASACGLPTIASRVGGIAEVVVDGKTGILVPPRDSRAIATAIIRLLDSEDVRTTMGRAARERAASEFAMTTMAERTLALYERCLSAKGVRKD